MQRFDSSGEGHLDLNDFSQLCRRVARAADIDEPLPLIALFNQADVTGAHRICASQWAWARAELAKLVDVKVRVKEQKRRVEAEEAAEMQRLALEGAKRNEKISFKALRMPAEEDFGVGSSTLQLGLEAADREIKEKPLLLMQG